MPYLCCGDPGDQLAIWEGPSECEPPPLEEEEEKQESEPQAIPPFPEQLTVNTQPNPEENELLEEVK